MSGLPDGVILGLDVGTVRTGVARGHTLVGSASPLVVIDMSTGLQDAVRELVETEQAQALVVGLPRNLSSEDTAQTAFVRQQIDSHLKELGLPLYIVDEALTSEKAEAELKARKKPYAKGDVDMLAACYILEDALLHGGGQRYA